MVRKSALILLSGLSLLLLSADKPAYQLFNQKGKTVTFDQWVNELNKADVVLFGELHNNPIVHWLQLEVTKSLHEKRKQKLVLGAEMFEADDQIIIDEYLAGKIKHKHLTSEAKVWNNYETDYKPLMEFAKENQLRFIATNIPRRYANIVARKDMEGLDELSDEAKKYIAPLPVVVDEATPGYAELKAMDMGHGAEMTGEKMMKAQAMKDATMAHFILTNRKEGELSLHYNGDYHSRSYGGIAWYLKEKAPNLKVMVISSEELEKLDFNKEYEGRADFMLLIPRSMTKTY